MDQFSKDAATVGVAETLKAINVSLKTGIGNTPGQIVSGASRRISGPSSTESDATNQSASTRQSSDGMDTTVRATTEISGSSIMDDENGQ
jgi:hypothetical protein